MNELLDSDEDVPLAMAFAKTPKRIVTMDENGVVTCREESTPTGTSHLESSPLTIPKITPPKFMTNAFTSRVLKLHKERLEASNTVDMLHEYKWPRSQVGEFFHIYEQFIAFLAVSVKDERLNGLEKRCVSEGEVEYLKEQGIYNTLKVKDIQAIKTEDAFLFLTENFPDKFKIYIKLVHQKEMRKLASKQEAQRVEMLKGKIPNIMKRSLKETVRFNSKLNQERMEERQAYFDLQTQIIHLPQKKQKYNPDNVPDKSNYPVALMPGQYQDYYKKYTPDELKVLPLNTVTGKLPQTLKKNQKKDDKSVESDDEDAASNLEDGEDEITDKPTAVPIKEGKDPFCGICMKGPEMNKRGLPERLIHCSQCENSGHPSCLDMNRDLVQVIQTYTWQCMECKICTECLAPHDEESMMFCDNCDRGYHSYCVGLKEIPKGRWVCDRCGKCSSCLGTNPVPDGGPGRWKNEVYKSLEEGCEPEFLQIHCHPCSKLFRKGSFCPVCLKVYRDSEDHINPMVCCDVCDRWIHTDCDGIDDSRYMELSKDRQASYKCILCRGEKEERMDSFHRKNR